MSQPSTLTASQLSALRLTAPAALPCYDYYEQKPHKAGPMGNVVFNSLDDLLPWLTVARPVTAKEAKKNGGCIVYYPAAETGVVASTPSYYRLPAPGEDVYEHSVYIPRHSHSSTAHEEYETFSSKDVVAMNKDVSIYSSGSDGCTDEECSC